MYKLIFGIALSWITAGSLSAQTKDNNSQTTTIYFNQSQYSNTTPVKKKKPGDKDIIKIAPLGFLRGSFPLLYERRLNDYLTLEGGIGLTHRNYVRGVFMSDDLGMEGDYESLNNDLSEPLYTFDQRKPALGYMFEIQPRFYLASEAMEGMYLALSMEMFRQNFTTPQPSYNGGGVSFNSANTIKEHEQIRDLMVYGGYQALYDQLSLETALGIGMRHINGEKYVVTDAAPGSFQDYSSNGITFNFTIRLGFQL